MTIDYSLNDRRIGLARAEKAWRSMIEACLERDVPVILLTPTSDTRAKLDDPEDPLRQHARQVRGLAAEYGIGLVDSLAAFDARRGRKDPMPAAGDFGSLWFGRQWLPTISGQPHIAA